jgi:hypothetical protein
MGSRKVPQISDCEIVARYLDGEARGMLGLRCKMPDSHIKAVLEAAGVPLRTPCEVKALLAKARYVPSRNFPKRRGHA